MAMFTAITTTNFTTQIRYVRSITLVETAGTPAATRWQLRNGTDGTNDTTTWPVGCPASGSCTVTPARPLYFPKGVKLELLSGSGRVTIDGY